jgi:hypothetical protein
MHIIKVEKKCVKRKALNNIVQIYGVCNLHPYNKMRCVLWTTTFRTTYETTKKYPQIKINKKLFKKIKMTLCKRLSKVVPN